jgi:hypothetical protein
MLHILGGVAGVAIGVVLAKASGEKLRPLFRSAVKTGLVASRKAQEFGQSLRSEVNQLVTEAKAELDNEPQGAVKQ